MEIKDLDLIEEYVKERLEAEIAFLKETQKEIKKLENILIMLKEISIEKKQ